jgi:hypothetical protein
MWFSRRALVDTITERCPAGAPFSGQGPGKCLDSLTFGGLVLGGLLVKWTLFFLFQLGTCGLFVSSFASAGSGKEKAKLADEAAPKLYGVTTEFAVKPTEINHADKLEITLKMTNVTRDSVKFRYSACIDQHVSLVDAAGKHVYRKCGAPIHECPYLEIDIPPGATVTRTASLAFGEFYSVPAGTYELKFEYDRRLMEPPGNLKDPWVPWSKARLKIVVKQ